MVCGHDCMNLKGNLCQYAELYTTSNFSFLHGASHPEELVTQAQALGYYALGISDCNTLAGIVRAHTVAKELGIPLLIGSRLILQGGFSVLAYPATREAYGNLCSLLTIGNRRASKGECFLKIEDLLQYHRDLVLILIPPFFAPHSSRITPEQEACFVECSRRIRSSVDTAMLSIAAVRNYSNLSHRHLQKTAAIAAELSLPLIATNAVLYHSPQRRPLQDVLTCIRNKCTVTQAGFLLQQNAEAYLKPLQEVQRLFRDLPHAIKRTIEVAEMAKSFSLDQLRYEYPDEICPEEKTPLEYLRELTLLGAGEKFPAGVPEKVSKLLDEELQLIHELGYEKYFLTCYDIVTFARQRQILCQGRGAAANSAVCFCLGITSVDPSRIDTLFARFVSKERNEPPDIDIDFEHERREEVIQYIYQKFGRERAGLTCEVVCYRHRSAIRETAKAMGLSLEVADGLARCVHRWTGYGLPSDDLREMGLDPHDPVLLKTIELSNELLGFPRHLSQHVGGFIISDKPLSRLVPILNAAMEERTIIEWDKDDIEALGMLKIDVLALGMLTCIRKALDFVNSKRNAAPIALHNIPAEDPAVYDMICAADTIGVFQIESRAQMSMLPRLRPRCFYDLVIEVAIVRPGPIQGNMVHPYLKRRNGIEKPYYPDARVEKILGKTLGVPLFQEQAMRLAIVLAQFTPDEAEALRRAIAAWKRDKGKIATFHRKIIAGMMANGYSLEFAESCMSQIKGFSEYGFPESHAASFALLVYASCWLKHYFPTEFAAALINSQPMGFYQPSQLLSDAQDHGVTVLPIDVNHSAWDCTIEPSGLRLGMRLVRGLQAAQVELITNAVKRCGRFLSIESLWNAAHDSGSKVRKATLQLLAKANAFQSMQLDTRQALWHIKALPAERLPLDAFIRSIDTAKVSLPTMTAQQEMFQDYESTGLSLRGHPIGFIRPYLDTRQVQPSRALKTLKRGKAGVSVSVAGIAIVRQRPGTARGVVFITLEDETGISNLIIRPKVFEDNYKIIVASACILAHGLLERSDDVIYINTLRVESLDALVKEQRDGMPLGKLPNKSYSY